MWVYDVMIVWNFARINNTPLSLIYAPYHLTLDNTYLHITREHHRMMKNNVYLELLNYSTFLSSGGERKA